MKAQTNTVKTGMRTAVLGVCLLAVSFVLLKALWKWPTAYLIEGALIWVLVTLFIMIPSVSSYFSSFPLNIKKVYIILFAVMFLAQMVSTPRVTFPFIPWNMFSSSGYAPEEVDVIRYIGHTQQGKQVVLVAPRYFRSLANGRIASDLDRLVKDIIGFDQDKQQRHEQKYQELKDHAESVQGLKKVVSLLRVNSFKEDNMLTMKQRTDLLNEFLITIGSKYNQNHPEDPVVAIDVLHGEMDITQRQNAKADLEPIWNVAIPAGRAR